MRGARFIQAMKVARKVFFFYHYCTPDEAKQKKEFHDVDAMVGSYRKTKVFCSNPFCCGNPRRMKGRKNVTRRELKSLDDYEFKEFNRLRGSSVVERLAHNQVVEGSTPSPARDQ